MPIVLSRVDDRLIHGQVVEGWLPVIQAERIVVVSDRSAQDSFQKSLMRLAVPDGIAVDVLTVTEAVVSLPKVAGSSERVLVLLAGVDELFRLSQAGFDLKRVNLGGLHDAPGRVMVLPHIALSPEERGWLTVLIKKGLVVDTKALPRDSLEPLPECLC